MQTGSSSPLCDIHTQTLQNDKNMFHRPWPNSSPTTCGWKMMWEACIWSVHLRKNLYARSRTSIFSKFLQCWWFVESGKNMESFNWSNQNLKKECCVIIDESTTMCGTWDEYGNFNFMYCSELGHYGQHSLWTHWKCNLSPSITQLECVKYCNLAVIRAPSIISTPPFFGFKWRYAHPSRL